MIFKGVSGIEWFFLTVWIVPVLIVMIILLFVYRHHWLDNLDCSKYAVFQKDELGPDDVPAPKIPAYCQLRYAEKHGLWGRWDIHNAWVWVAIGINLLWIFVVLGAFLWSRGVFR